MLVILLLIIFSIYCIKSADRHPEWDEMSQHDLDLGNGGGSCFDDDDEFIEEQDEEVLDDEEQDEEVLDDEESE